jgi:hypothetical protein
MSGTQFGQQLAVMLTAYVVLILIAALVSHL